MTDIIVLEQEITALIKRLYESHQIENEDKLKQYLDWKVGLSEITFNYSELLEMKLTSELNLKTNLESRAESPDIELNQLKQIAFTKIDEDLSFLIKLCSS